MLLALTLAQHPDVTHGYTGHQLATDLLSGTDHYSVTHPAGTSPGRDGRTSALLLAEVSEGRALLVALLVVVAGYEADAPNIAWRSPNDLTTRYLLPAPAGRPRIPAVRRRAPRHRPGPAAPGPAGHPDHLTSSNPSVTAVRAMDGSGGRRSGHPTTPLTKQRKPRTSP